MALIYVDELTVGMVLAADLKTCSGRFVLAEGARLAEDHLKILRDWGVFEVDITEESLGHEYHRRQALRAQFQEQAETYLWRRFALNDMDQEPLASIYRHALSRFTRSLERGWEPVAFSPRQLDEVASDQNPLSVPQLLAGDVQLVSLPNVYNQIVETLNDPKATAMRIAEAISKDATLSLRLLRLVNSPLYGFPGKIDSISRAVSLIGTDELATLALGVTLARQFSQIPTSLIDMDAFWRHSIRCALFARYLAEECGEKSLEQYFTGGLIHDIGRLIMLARMPGAYGRAILHGRSEQLPMYRAEQDCLQTDHSIVGKLLGMRWRLSPSLTRMVGGHHAPVMHHYSREASILHLADFLAHAFGHEATLVNQIPPLQVKAWQECGLNETVFLPLMHRVDSEFSAILRLFFADSAGSSA